MTSTPEVPDSAFTLDSVYIAGFTQARAPHLGLLLVEKSVQRGRLYHIRIDRESAPTWQLQYRTQVIDKDMFLSSLLRIHENEPIPSSGTETESPDTADDDSPAQETTPKSTPEVRLRLITDETMRRIVESVPPPSNDEFGECAPWVMNVIQHLHVEGFLKLKDGKGLEDEMDAFARGSKMFARRDRFPCTAVSQFCQSRVPVNS